MPFTLFVEDIWKLLLAFLVVCRTVLGSYSLSAFYVVRRTGFGVHFFALCVVCRKAFENYSAFYIACRTAFGTHFLRFSLFVEQIWKVNSIKRCL